MGIRGYDENLEVLKRFGDLKPGCKMLDIGVGIGGGARQAARNEKDTRVRYQISDALEYEFPASSFDYVFSRDGLHHNERIDIVMRRIFVCFTVAFHVFRYCNHYLASHHILRRLFFIAKFDWYAVMSLIYIVLILSSCIVMKSFFLGYRSIHWLKPGGKVLITIYGMGHGTLSAKFQAYVEKRKYFLKTLEEMVEFCGIQNTVPGQA
uniref:phosphoethanolamine N-methyltransferase n=1 Tax=Parascaris equorum TaxID=6256 RepID=A0A914RTU6_PAREQ